MSIEIKLFRTAVRAGGNPGGRRVWHDSAFDLTSIPNSFTTRDRKRWRALDSRLRALLSGII